MTEPIKLLVCLGDLHCGSTVGLWPGRGLECFNGNDPQDGGNVVMPNATQRWLWKCWGEAMAWGQSVVGDDPWALLLMGDLIEGNHHGGSQIASTDTADHVLAAEHILAPLAERADRVLAVRGTECHVGNREEALVRYKLGGEIADRLEIDIHGCLVAAAHHVSTSSRPYLEASAYSIHMGVETIEATRSGHRSPDVMIRAHRHRGGAFTDDAMLGMVTHPWQMLTRYGKKVVTAAKTSPGITILDWRHVEHGELPHRRARRFAPTQQEPIQL